MKDEKYYTPQPEEIHIGFEYQERKLFTDCWSNRIFQLNEPFWLKEIRVKHLDHEGKLELGWVLKGIEAFKRSYHFGNEFELVFNERNGHVVVHNLYDCNCIFSGHLLNKSELSRLMRQLGIKNEKK